MIASPSLPGPVRRQRGAMAVMSAVLIALLVGMTALVVDLGRLYVFRTELQNAMDACALAASGALTGAQDPGLFQVAKLRGRALLVPPLDSKIPVNRVHFQRDMLDIDAARLLIDFSDEELYPKNEWYDPPEGSTDHVQAADTRYVRCRYDDSGIPLLLAPVLNLIKSSGTSPVGPTTTLGAQAVAKAKVPPVVTTACSLPMAMCAAGPAPDYGLKTNKRYTLLPSGSTTYDGHFAWVDYTDYYGPGQGGGADEVAFVIRTGHCSVKPGQDVPYFEEGEKESMRAAWNTRFGIYNDSTSNLFGHFITSDTTAYPDIVNLGYPKEMGFADYRARSTVTPFQGSLPTTSGAHNYEFDEAKLLQHGKPKRRIATMPVVDCGTLVKQKKSTISAMACVFLLAPVRTDGEDQKQVGKWLGADDKGKMSIEFTGLTSDPYSACNAGGGNGVGGGSALVQ